MNYDVLIFGSHVNQYSFPHERYSPRAGRFHPGQTGQDKCPPECHAWPGVRGTTGNRPGYLCDGVTGIFTFFGNRIKTNVKKAQNI